MTPFVIQWWTVSKAFDSEFRHLVGGSERFSLKGLPATTKKRWAYERSGFDCLMLSNGNGAAFDFSRTSGKVMYHKLIHFFERKRFLAAIRLLSSFLVARARVLSILERPEFTRFTIWDSLASKFSGSEHVNEEPGYLMKNELSLYFYPFQHSKPLIGWLLFNYHFKIRFRQPSQPNTQPFSSADSTTRPFKLNDSIASNVTTSRWPVNFPGLTQASESKTPDKKENRKLLFTDCGSDYADSGGLATLEIALLLLQYSRYTV